MSFLTTWLDHYGYLVLFISLMLELIAVGIPTEILMSYAGFLVFEGKMNWAMAIVSAAFGSMIGISISYVIGFKLGASFFYKYGHKIHLGPDKLEKTSRWFGKYGNKLLVVAYFIPGVRHITGYFSGITRIPFPKFALFAYLGAWIWVSSFISLGKVLGPKWEQFHSSITKYLLYAGIVAAIIIGVIYFVRRFNPQVKATLSNKLGKAVQSSPWRIKVLFVGGGIVFVLLFAVMIGLIQDYLAQEFTDFDLITRYLVQTIFDPTWLPVMKQLDLLASLKAIIPLLILILLWIIIKSKEKTLEIGFLLSVTIGGELLNEGLRRLFHRVGPHGSLLTGSKQYTFPSEQSLMALTFYGFAAFLLIRHMKQAWIRTLFVLIVLVISFLVGLSRIFLELQYPSDVMAGYVFGAVWLSLNIMLLEIFRLLRKM